MNTMDVALGAQFVEVLCGDCVLRIDADAEDHFVEVRLIMAHPPAGGWRYRLREAWKVWRGLGHEWFDFYTRMELEAFIAALERAKPVLIYNEPVSSPDKTTDTPTTNENLGQIVERVSRLIDEHTGRVFSADEATDSQDSAL